MDEVGMSTIGKNPFFGVSDNQMAEWLFLLQWPLFCLTKKLQQPSQKYLL